MSYRLVRKLQQEAVPVTQACRLLQISRAGYYQHWQRRGQAADIVTTVHLKAAFTASGSTYGSRRLGDGACHAYRTDCLGIGHGSSAAQARTWIAITF